MFFRYLSFAIDFANIFFYLRLQRVQKKFNIKHRVKAFILIYSISIQGFKIIHFFAYFSERRLPFPTLNMFIVNVPEFSVV